MFAWPGMFVWNVLLYVVGREFHFHFYWNLFLVRTTLKISQDDPNTTCAFWDEETSTWSSEGVVTLFEEVRRFRRRVEQFRTPMVEFGIILPPFSPCHASTNFRIVFLAFDCSSGNRRVHLLREHPSINLWCGRGRIPAARWHMMLLRANPLVDQNWIDGVCRKQLAQNNWYYLWTTINYSISYHNNGTKQSG